MDALRLGLLSTANINGHILAAAGETDRVTVDAVGSRDAAVAEAYASEHGIARAHGSYDGLLDDAATVTITAIDPKAPAVTVKSDRGIMSFRVKDAKNLEGYKVGDTVDVTYTRALAVTVEPDKK